MDPWTTRPDRGGRGAHAERGSDLISSCHTLKPSFLYGPQRLVTCPGSFPLGPGGTPLSGLGSGTLPVQFQHPFGCLACFLGSFSFLPSDFSHFSFSLPLLSLTYSLFLHFFYFLFSVFLSFAQFLFPSPIANTDRLLRASNCTRHWQPTGGPRCPILLPSWRLCQAFRGKTSPTLCPLRDPGCSASLHLRPGPVGLAAECGPGVCRRGAQRKKEELHGMRS